MRTEVLSHVPGRVRLHFPNGLGDAPARLTARPGVRSVQANPVTQNVVVEFDPKMVSLDDLRRHSGPRRLNVHKVLRRLNWLEAICALRWPAMMDLVFSSPRSRRWLRRRLGRRMANTVTLVQTVAGLALADTWLGLGLAAVELVRWTQRWLKRRAQARPLVPPRIGLFVEMSPQAILTAGRDLWTPPLAIPSQGSPA